MRSYWGGGGGQAIDSQGARIAITIWPCPCAGSVGRCLWSACQPACQLRVSARVRRVYIAIPV